MANLNETPYRVTFVARQGGYHRAVPISEVFATLEEARAHADKCPKGRSVWLQKPEGVTASGGWGKGGRWVDVK